MEKEFKIGDTVKLLRDSLKSGTSLKKGDIGDITKIEGNIAYINVSDKRHNSENNTIHLNGLKLLKNELPVFKIIKQRANKITMVQNNEGNIFGIGDTVKFLPEFGKSVQDVNKVMKITGFRYRNDRTNLCAVTDTHPEYGVGIEKIQHVLEFEKEFILPEKWAIKVTDISRTKILNWFQKNKLNQYSGSYEKTVRNNEFMHYPQIRSTNSHRGFRIHTIENTHIEITFEQFKKYVLKEEEPIKEETLLEKAKRLYTQGTIIRRIVGPSKNSDIELKSYTNNYEVLESTYNGVYAIYASNYVIYTHEEGWAKILNPKLKVGDTFKVGWNQDIATIIRIETINNQEVAFFRNSDGNTSNHYRILTKNIKEWTSV